MLKTIAPLGTIRNDDDDDDDDEDEDQDDDDDDMYPLKEGHVHVICGSSRGFIKGWPPSK